MATVSLKIDDPIFRETEEIRARIKKPRNRYINEALDHYNQYQRRLIIEKKLEKESGMVRDESLSVLRDFEDIDYGD
jgi:predicted transcriptional regulator